MTTGSNSMFMFRSTNPVSRMKAVGASTAAKATFSPPITIQRSPWHSPVPYLFGGLAAILGLVAFALVVLACSYWRHSRRENGSQRDVESGAPEKGESGSDAKALPVFEEKLLVIMAGEGKPTFLATPMSGRVPSINDENVETREKEESIIKEQGETSRQENGEESGAESHMISQEQIQ